VIDPNRVHALREKRFAYLKRLYELALQGQGDARSGEVARAVGLTHVEQDEIEEVLNDEGYIAFTANGTDRPDHDMGQEVRRGEHIAN
jgi:hypothetical protein